MLVEVDHVITYRYANPVSISQQIVRLYPNIGVADYSFSVTPESATWDWLVAYRDHRYAVVSPIEQTDVFEVRSRFVADVDDDQPAGAGSLMDVCKSVHEKVRYLDRPTGDVQEPSETLELGTGTCRDFAWLLTDTLVRQGHPARFVSGYYVHLEAMTAELHAWTEAKKNGRWIGLDPTLCEPVGRLHIPVASARHHRNAAPISGSISPPTDVEFGWSIACRPYAVAA